MINKLEDKIKKAEHINGLLIKAYMVQEDTIELLYTRVLELEKNLNEEIIRRVQNDINKNK